MGMAEQPREPEPDTDTPGSFYRRLPGSIVYPIRGRGKWVILGWTVSLVVAALIGTLASVVPFLGLVAFAIMAVLLCIVPRYLLEVAGRTAGGEDEPPDWPAITNARDDLLKPVVLVLTAMVISFLPTIALIVADRLGGFSNDVLMWVSLGVGIVCLPMSVLAVSLFDSTAALNPILVVRGIVRTMPAYLVACAALLVVAAMWGVAATSGLARFPLVGQVAGAAISLYLLMAAAHIVGLVYRFHKHRLAWFE